MNKKGYMQSWGNFIQGIIIGFFLGAIILYVIAKFNIIAIPGLG